MDAAVAEVLLEACNVIEQAQNEKRAALAREGQYSDALSNLLEHLADKGIVSPEKRAYLDSRVGKDNLEVIAALEKSASRHNSDNSLGAPSEVRDASGMDPIAKFAMS